MVELGCVDICLEASVISSHMVMSREDSIVQLFHIFAYLKKVHNTELVFDLSVSVIDESKFQRRDWASRGFGYV